MTLLEEPEFTADCNSSIQAAMADFSDDSVANEACAFETFDIHKFVSADLLQRAPEVAAFLNRMFVGTARVNELAAYMELEEKTAEETAVHFLMTYENQWNDWVPAVVFADVKACLN